MKHIFAVFAALLITSSAFAFEPTAIMVSTTDTDVGTSVTSSTVVAFTTASGTETISPVDLEPGSTYRVTVAGTYGTTDTDSGTLELIVQAGTTTLISSGELTLTDDTTAKPFNMSALFTVRSTGATGSILSTAEGRLCTATTPIPIQPAPNTATVNTTMNQAIRFKRTFSVEDAYNNFTVNHFLIERLR